MKKTLTAFLAALFCVTACAFGLVACDGGENDDRVACTLSPTPEHVREVQLEIAGENTTVGALGSLNDIWSTPKQIDKNKELVISVALDTFYELGSLKMSINGAETALTGSDGVYSCTYTPTADFTISFVGAAKLETTTIALEKIDWQPLNNYFAGQDDAAKKVERRKALICDNFYVKLLVNGVETAPLKHLRLTEFNFANDRFQATVNMSDGMEFILYTENADLSIYNENALSVDYQVGADIVTKLSDDKKSLSVKISQVINTVSIAVNVDCITAPDNL